MSEFIQWIEHKGRRILLADYSGIHEEEEYLGAIEDLEAELLGQPPGQKILLLLDVSNTRLSTEVTERAKRMMQVAKEAGIPDSPTSLAGLSGFQKAVVQAIRFVRSDLHVADSREESMDWLVEQA